MRFLGTEFSDARVTADIMVRQDKMEKLKDLYAAIVMRIGAGIAEEWETVLYGDMRIDENTGTFIDKEDIIELKDIPNPSHRYWTKPPKSRHVGNNHESWLAKLAPYLEDGFIKLGIIAMLKSKCYAIKDGKLYDVRYCSGHKADYFGSDYRMFELIGYHYNNEGEWVEYIRTTHDENTGEWFSYGNPDVRDMTVGY